MPRFHKYCVIAVTSVTLISTCSFAAQSPRSAAHKGASSAELAKRFLHKDWQVQSSCDDKVSGEKISTAGFDASQWHNTDIPATVVAVLVTDKTYPDPTYGTNLKSFPA